MEKVDIYYFSGTGNSFVVAEYLAKKLNGRLIAVTSRMNQTSITVEANVVGFVFPTYDFKPPRIMEDFVRKLKHIGSAYLFAVCTYGLAASRSLHHFDKVLQSCGGHLSAGFTVPMPHNGIGSGAMDAAQHRRMYESWKIKRDEIYAYIDARNEGKIEASNWLIDFFRPPVLKMMPYALKFLMVMLFKGVNSLVLKADSNCDGCGICKVICPVNNIEIIDAKPRWSDHCVSCFACLHWCPEEAISLGGINMNIKRYHHPEVTIADMLKGR
ncbi:EFR1 family ferrodoxin [candidate division KSB1 bacterium]|nr:EFR1 family ferrodoxin [candidate division KSB1 bacterium]